MGAIALLTAALIVSAQPQHQHQIYDRPINDSLRLRVTVSYATAERDAGACCSTSTLVSVLLVDNTNANRYWQIATISEQYEISFRVERADDHALVLSRADPGYGVDQGSIKLFFDARTKRLLNRIDFKTSHDIIFADDAAAVRALGVTPDVLRRLRLRGVFSAHDDDPSLPTPFVTYPLPQSTYQEFARARPDRVRGGYAEGSTTLEERIGAYQLQDDRFWFGKAFYDGEGTSGVGAIGYLDAAGKYTFLRIPELFDRSVQGFLVEDDTLWAGRVSHPEGADYSGGLLRYDRKTGRVTLYPVPDVIHSVAHVGGAVFLGTNHGLYVIRDGKRTRYRAEPDITGRFIVVSESY